jgi:hypothetical protein
MRGRNKEAMAKPGIDWGLFRKLDEMAKILGEMIEPYWKPELKIAHCLNYWPRLGQGEWAQPETKE